MSLDGQKVVIIGGTSGIGFATAKAAVRAGAQVVIASSRPDRVDSALERLPGTALGRVMDVTSEEQVRGFFDWAREFDHLIYTAGDRPSVTELAAMDIAYARQAFDIRYWGAITAVKHGHRFIRPGGSIGLSSGTASARPQNGWTLVASISGAIEALARALAVELAPTRVNSVAPGMVRTELWDVIPEHQREAMYKRVGQASLTGRVADAADVAEAHLYLMAQSHCTGTTLVVDGGGLLV
jgi:NAD(P)-dependent dehydrogenase (short-subunit alcohol dehydrogenase family)